MFDVGDRRVKYYIEKSLEKELLRKTMKQNIRSSQN